MTKYICVKFLFFVQYILRVIPFKYMQEEIHFHQEFQNLHYVPVAKSYIDQVHISIKGDTGEE